MALLAEIEAILKELTPAEAVEARKFYEANPGAQEVAKKQFLAQSDYSRQIQEATKRKKEADELYNKNMDWFKTNSAEVDQLENENKTLKAEIDKVKAGIPAALASGAPPEEITKLNTTVASLQKMLEDTQKSLKDSESKVETRFNAGAGWMLQLEDIADEHKRTFNEPFSRSDFMKFVNESKIDDPRAAYEKMTEGKRMDKMKADIEADIRKKLDVEYAAKIVPYATGQSFAEKGPLQYYINKTDEAPKNIAEATSRAAQELVQEGKG